MKAGLVVPARWQLNETDGRPYSLQYGDHYHPHACALAQARQVFLEGNGLPGRWRDGDRFVVLETGFGLGNNFLATWDAWRKDSRRCKQLHFISIEKHPLSRADLAQLHRSTPLRDLADALINAWPPLTPDLHSLSFDGGQVRLMLAMGDVLAWLPQLVASVDAIYLDGFEPACNPDMWQPRVFKALARLAAPSATAATWTSAQAVRDGLRTAGFAVEPPAGSGGKRDITLARYAPRFTPRRVAEMRAATVPAPAPAARRAVIVGAGLAGCAAAWALAQQGWRCTLIDKHALPAQEGSGNPAGLFHGIVNAQDGAHARFNRAAALQAQRLVRHAVSALGVAGSADGLLRLESSGATIEAMRAQLERLAMPADFVEALDDGQASERCGLPLAHPAWFYPGGGWVAPGELARALLGSAGALATYVGGKEVRSFRRSADGWELLDSLGLRIDCCETLILANAFDAMRLLGSPAWPIQKVRGQISLLATDGGLTLPSIPITGAGYLLPAVAGRAVFGATSQPDDDDPSVRRDDHLRNLSQLAQWVGNAAALVLPEQLQGRTGWRMVCRDRLPIIGAVPDTAGAEPTAATRMDHARLVPRQPGLFVFAGLGSRGITWSALGAQILASSITGAPQPVEASLLDAVDPARFVSREVRRSIGGG